MSTNYSNSTYTQLNGGDIHNPDNYTSQMEYLKMMTKYYNLDNPVPFITARSWVMMDVKNSEILFAK